MRLDKYLCQTASLTRTKAKEQIKKGCVTVNGRVVNTADYKIDENNDIIILNGEMLAYKEFHYYILNKPAGVITAVTDPCQATVMDCLKKCKGKNLFPVGRLDKDTEGLLLITDDGELAHNLLSPGKHVDKEYLVGLKYPITQEACRRLQEGVDIQDDKLTLPAKVVICGDDTIRLTIREGRYHQVKRMLQAVGNEVTSLKRLSMGPLSLPPDLQEGAYRELKEEEVNELKNIGNDRREGHERKSSEG